MVTKIWLLTRNRPRNIMIFFYRFHALPTRVPTKKLNEICVYVY